MSRLVASDDFVQVNPVGPDDRELAKHVKQFMQWALRSNVQVEKVMRPHNRDLLLDGTKDIIPVWFEETNLVRQRVITPTFTGPNGPVPAQMAAQMAAAKKADPEKFAAEAGPLGFREGPPTDDSEVVESTQFRVKWIGCDITDSFFPDDGAPFEEQPFLRFIYVNIETLKDLEKNGPYKNISDVLAPYYQTTERHEETTTDTEAKGVTYSAYAREAKLLECYVKWDGEWRLATFAPDYGWIEVRNQPMRDVYWHGKKPVVRTTIYKDSDESMGRGIPEIVREYHVGINAMWNQIVDYSTIEVMPGGFYNESAIGMRGKTLTMEPGKLKPIPADSKIHYSNVPTKSQVFIQYIELLMTFFERTIGIMDYNMGRASGSTGAGGDTASGMQMIIAEGEKNHNFMGDGIAQIYEELLKQTLALYAQYMPLGFSMALFENSGWVHKAVDVAALQGEYDIKIVISDRSNNDQLNRQKKVALLSLLSKVPGINIKLLVEKVLESEGYTDLDQFFQPQFTMLQQALAVGGDELMGLLQQFIQQKTQDGRVKELTEQAQDNNLRGAIQRENADGTMENQKLVDQGEARYKSGVIDQVLAQTGGRI